MLLESCLNGGRVPGAHSALPLTLRALADDAQAVVAAGAEAMHIHSRDAHGAESLAAQDVALQRGLDTRIELEDTLSLPDGSPARDNAQHFARYAHATSVPRAMLWR